MATNGVDGSETSADRNVEIWKIKKLIKSLEAARGNGTSMISLIIPPKDQISRVAKMLADEFGTASNIKSRVNRLSVLGAITSVQQRLKLYNKVPTNGLVIYCGTIVTDEGKEKKVNIDFEPFRPINTSLYLCDNKFHTEALTALLADDNKFGFIVMDGNGALFGTLSGNTREVLHKFTVDLPKKHGRGGQSALRFARLRMEKRHNYVRKVAEVAVQMFITNDKPNIAGLVLAGSADFKTELSQSDMFDPRLQAKIIKVVDVSYGGENGFNQAIELAADALSNVKFIQEKKLIGRYFDEISQDTGKYCFGVDDSLKGLEMGAVDILIVWENLDITRYVLKNHSTDVENILFLKPEQEKDKTHFIDKDTGVELELVEQMPLLEWFANNYKNFDVADLWSATSENSTRTIRATDPQPGHFHRGMTEQISVALSFDKNLKYVKFSIDNFSLNQKKTSTSSSNQNNTYTSKMMMVALEDQNYHMCYGLSPHVHFTFTFTRYLFIKYRFAGATLEIITDRSQEGAQFVRGFGGIGGILRYQVDFQVLDPNLDDMFEDFDLDDY